MKRIVIFGTNQSRFQIKTVGTEVGPLLQLNLTLGLLLCIPQPIHYFRKPDVPTHIHALSQTD